LKLLKPSFAFTVQPLMQFASALASPGEYQGVYQIGDV
jgi:hypothetical protein